MSVHWYWSNKTSWNLNEQSNLIRSNHRKQLNPVQSNGIKSGALTSLTSHRLLIHPPIVHVLVGNVFLIGCISGLVFSVSWTTGSPDPDPSKASPDPPALSLGGPKMREAMVGGGRYKRKLWPISNLKSQIISINLLFTPKFSLPWKNGEESCHFHLILVDKFQKITFNRLRKGSIQKKVENWPKIWWKICLSKYFIDQKRYGRAICYVRVGFCLKTKLAHFFGPFPLLGLCTRGTKLWQSEQWTTDQSEWFPRAVGGQGCLPAIQLFFILVNSIV